MSGAGAAGAPTGRRTVRVASLAATALAVSVVASVLLSPLVVRTPAVQGAEASHDTTTLAPASSAPQDLTALPLLRTGHVEAAFPGGAGLEHDDRVRLVAEALGSDAGLDGAMPLLWSGMAGFEVGDELNPSYPYDYPTLTEFRQALTPTVLRAHPDELVDLAHLLAPATAHGRTCLTTDPTMSAALEQWFDSFRDPP